MSEIAFLGLGAMGARMARRLAGAGHRVRLYNRTPPARADWADLPVAFAPTPRAAAEGADFVISMVRDDDAARAVWLDARDGAAHSLAREAIAIEASTVTPAWIAELAAQVAARGAALLDAPVAGSRPQADAGTLIFLIGGDAAELARAAPVLQVMGGSLHHAGNSGRGAALKLAVNALYGIQVAALADLIGLLAQHDDDLPRALDILAELPVLSPGAKAALGLIRAGNHAPLFPISLVAKDLDYFLQATTDTAPLVACARDRYRAAEAAGDGGLNVTGIARRSRAP